MKPGKPEQVLAVLLRVLAAVFLLAMALYALGPLLHVSWLPFNAGFFQQLPFVSNSVVKVGILLACCLYAAGDLRRRFGLVVIVLLAHLVSVAAMLILLATSDTSRVLNPGFGGDQPVGRLLWGAIMLDGVIFLVLGTAAVAAYRSLRRSAPPIEPQERWLTPAEQWLKRLLYVLGGIFIVATIGYELGPISGIAPDFFRELPFVTNSVVKTATLALVCLYVARRLRRHMSLVGPVVAVHLLSVVVQILYLVTAPPALDVTVELAGRTMTMGQVLTGAIILDTVIGGLLLAMYLAAWRARLAAEFFRPIEFRTLIALAEIMLVGPDEQITPGETAANIDRALARMRTERKGTFRLALFAIHYWPLLSLQAPLPDLSASVRTEFVRRRFYREPGKRNVLRFLKPFLQAFMRVGHQLTNLGYYNDPRVHASIAYTTFSKRPRFSQLDRPPRAPHPLSVMRPADITGDTIRTEVCIIGSGAGGGILAYSLAKDHDVLVLERGAYVEPRFFVEDELQQLGALYDGGMLQLSQDYRFSVLQGNCVGGSTTVNNGICFDPPPEVLSRWNDPRGQQAGLDLDLLEQSTKWVRRFLRVNRLPASGHHQAAELIRPTLQQGGSRWKLGLPEVFEANIAADEDRACFGCGCCNIGCGHGKKFSMLDTALPWGQREFGGHLQILAECEVERIRTLSGRPARALGLRARLSDGRQVTIDAEKVIVAAGAIGSSYLLLRSGIGRQLPVGRGLAFNMMTPVFAEFPQPLNSYDGIQMGHYVRHAQNEFIIETWFSPPVGLATAMPGWFDEHYWNMRRAGHMVAFGMVVGTESIARVTQPITGGAGFKYVPSGRDLRRLGHGLHALADVLLEAGARRVMLNTWDNSTYTDRASLERIERAAADPTVITLASAHPQGGNAISRDWRRGVVDDSFRVHGYENLYVCDASVFPGSIQVNPQLTVMSLARYAAECVFDAGGTAK